MCGPCPSGYDTVGQVCVLPLGCEINPPQPQSDTPCYPGVRHAPALLPAHPTPCSSLRLVYHADRRLRFRPGDIPLSA